MASDPSAQHDPADLLRLLTVTRQLARPVALEEVLTAVIDAARRVLRADRGSVFLVDGDELYTLVGTGLTAQAIRVPIDRGVVGETARTRRAVRIDDAYADARFDRSADAATGYRTRNLLSLPLVGVDDELVGVLQVLNKDGGSFADSDLALAELIAAQAAAALQRARLFEDRLARTKLQADLEIARQVQQDVLPRSLPEVEGYQFAGHAKPAEETGGDLFDVLSMDGGRLGLLLADATGHGIGAALPVTQTRSMLRLGARLGSSWVEITRAVNAQLMDDLALTRFVTLFFGRLDPARHTLDYVAAGQAPLLHHHAEGDELSWHDATTMPLGIHAPLPEDG